MKVTTCDLVNINNAAKTIKQRNFIIMNHRLYGIDNLAYRFIYSDSVELNFEFPNGVIINTRKLSAFLKTITTETEFIIKNNPNGSMEINTIADTLEMFFDNSIYVFLSNKLNAINSYNFIEHGDVSEELERLFSMKKDDGALHYIHNSTNPSSLYSRYFMIIFSGIFPIAKSDKISLSICDTSQTSFTAKFTIHKKKNVNTTVVIAFLRI